MDTTLEIVVGLMAALPAILFVAFLASRLLGVRRSWVAILTSGAAGYGIGTLVALVASGFDLESSGFDGVN